MALSSISVQGVDVFLQLESLRVTCVTHLLLHMGNYPPADKNGFVCFVPEEKMKTGRVRVAKSAIRTLPAIVSK